MTTLDDNLTDDLTLDDSAKQNLLTAAKWGKFLAILGFIGIGLMVVAAFFMGSIFRMSGMNDVSPMPLGNMTSMITIMYLIIAVIYFFPVWYLFKFSENAKKAVLNNQQMSVTEAMNYLKRMFKFMGVFTLAIFGLYAMAIIASLSGALLGGLF